MTFGQLQSMVLADGFAEAKRADAKVWINAAYQRIWDLEQWAFKTATDACNAVGGTQALQGTPADLGTVLHIFAPDGEDLRPFQEERAFFRRYGAASDVGTPEAFVVIGGSSILLGPIPDSAYSFTLVYEKALTQLVADQDVPAIPAGYHMAIVHGARAHGFRLLGIPLAASEEEAETNLLLAMRMSHMSAVRGEIEQARAYRPI